MNPAHNSALAQRYLVDDLPGAHQPGARLHGILQRIEVGAQITPLARQFLASTGLLALDALASGQLLLAEFQAQAATERNSRIQQASIKAAEAEVEAARIAAAKADAVRATFAAMANDPVLRRKREAKDLRRRFGLGYVDDEHYGRVIGLLKQVEKGQRLRTEDVAWLRAEAEYCWTDELQKAWHRLEAQALTEAWERTGDAWNAVNASGHWRKAGDAERALSLTEKALAQTSLSPKLQSALSTTRGGAMRDLRRLEGAEALGRQAHSLTPGDYRPCTLLGAVLLERGDLAGGHDWYAKAEQLGASRKAIDQDLRSLLVRLPSQERQRICDYLIAQDPERFAWLLGRREARARGPGRVTRARLA